ERLAGLLVYELGHPVEVPGERPLDVQEPEPALLPAEGAPPRGRLTGALDRRGDGGGVPDGMLGDDLAGGRVQGRERLGALRGHGHGNLPGGARVSDCLQLCPLVNHPTSRRVTPWVREGRTTTGRARARPGWRPLPARARRCWCRSGRRTPC